MARKSKKYTKASVIITITVALILVIAFVVLYFTKPALLDKWLGTNFAQQVNGGGDNADNGGDSSVVVGAQEDIVSADLSIHFLELGNQFAGDCTLIKCGNTEVLIDAGSIKKSATTIQSYINKYCTDGVLEYVIATHSHEDHIAAFIGNKNNGERNGILYKNNVQTLIQYDFGEEDKALYGEFEEAVEYAKTEYGTTVYTASQCYDEVGGAKRQYYLDAAQTVSINILYNYYYYHQDKNDNNNHSVVTLLTQELPDDKKLNYLFTGDLEKEGEEKLAAYYKNVPATHQTEYNVLPQVELFKAGHHGSPTSSNDCLLEMIRPKNVAVCCCCGTPEYTKTNDNTFPSQAMISRMKPYTENIYATSLVTYEEGKAFPDSGYGFTSMNGNIVFYYHENELKLYCSNNTTKLKDTAWFAQNRKWE